MKISVFSIMKWILNKIPADTTRDISMDLNLLRFSTSCLDYLQMYMLQLRIIKHYNNLVLTSD